VVNIFSSNSAPAAVSAAQIGLDASQIVMPPNSGRVEANLPSPITGVRISSSFMPCALHEMKSSWP
jgi:hypothetical protein